MSDVKKFLESYSGREVLKKYRLTDQGLWEASQGEIVIIGMFVWAGCALVFFINIQGFLLVWFAPKIWLIKEIVHLVK